MEQHEEKLKVSPTFELKILEFCMKSTKGFEQGKTFFVIHILSADFVFIIPTFEIDIEIDVQPKFYHVDIIISKFCN